MADSSLQINSNDKSLKLLREGFKVFLRAFLCFFGLANLVGALWFLEANSGVVTLSGFAIGFAQVFCAFVPSRILKKNKMATITSALIVCLPSAVLIIDQMDSYPWVSYGVISARFIELVVLLVFVKLALMTDLKTIKNP